MSYSLGASVSELSSSVSLSCGHSGLSSRKILNLLLMLLGAKGQR